MPKGPGTAEVQAMALATGQSASTWERRARPLRAEGLAPSSSPGGGKGRIPYEPIELVYLIFSPAGEPIEAAQTAKALAPLIYAKTEEFFKNQSPATNKSAIFSQTHDFSESRAGKPLGQALAHLTVKLSRHNTDIRRALEAEYQAMGVSLTVSLDPVFAEISWTEIAENFERRIVDRYEPPQANPPVSGVDTFLSNLDAPRAKIGRITVIPFTLFFVAAELLAKSSASSSGLLPPDEASSHLKTETPTTLAGGPASDTDPTITAVLRDSRTLTHTRQIMSSPQISQRANGVEVRSEVQPPGESSHDRSSSDHASAA